MTSLTPENNLNNKLRQKKLEINLGKKHFLVFIKTS